MSPLDLETKSSASLAQLKLPKIWKLQCFLKDYHTTKHSPPHMYDKVLFTEHMSCALYLVSEIWNSFYPKQWHITGWEGRVSEWTLTICQYTTLFTWRARPNLLVTTAHKITITNCASWTDLRSVRSGSGVDKRNRFLDPALSMSKMATESGQRKSGRA